MARPIVKEPSATWSGARLKRLNQQTAALLNQIQAVAGVQWALVCDNHGKLLGAHGSAILEREVLDSVGLRVAQVFASLEARGGKPQLIEFCFDRKSLFTRDLGNAIVIIMGVASMDMALLRIVLNIAALPFEQDSDLQGSLSEAAPSRADTLEEKSLDAAARRLAKGMRSQG